MATLEEDSTVSIKFSASDSDDGEEDNLIFILLIYHRMGYYKIFWLDFRQWMMVVIYIISGDSITIFLIQTL